MMNRLEKAYGPQRRFNIGKVTDSQIAEILANDDPLPLVKGGQDRDTPSMLDSALIVFVAIVSAFFGIAGTLFYVYVWGGK